MASKTKHSIEERVEDWCKQQFKGQKYYTKTESINPEIEDALCKAPSKKKVEVVRIIQILSVL